MPELDPSSQSASPSGTASPDGAAPPHGAAAWELLERAQSVLLLHAHPDDESLATGALIHELAQRCTPVHLVTATRGEMGDVVPGALPPDATHGIGLEEARRRELDAACTALGVSTHRFLGDGVHASGRRYRDSGMVWVREGLAGPDPATGGEAFTSRPLEQAVADLLAVLDELSPEALLSYDDAGTYGHPDHVHAHHVAQAAAHAAGLPLLEFASSADAEGFVWREHPRSLAAVETALRGYRSQFTVTAVDAAAQTIAVTHVGGQDDVISLRTGLRRCRD